MRQHPAREAIAWLLPKARTVRLSPLCAFFVYLLGITAVAFTTEVSSQDYPEPTAKQISSTCREDIFPDRTNSPARIGYMPLGAYCTLENHSDKRIVRYRLGCAIEENGRVKILNKKKEKAIDLPPADPSKSAFPFTYLSIRQIKKCCTSKGAKIAIVEVTFADGSSWRPEE